MTTTTDLAAALADATGMPEGLARWAVRASIIRADAVGSALRDLAREREAEAEAEAMREAIITRAPY